MPLRVTRRYVQELIRRDVVMRQCVRVFVSYVRELIQDGTHHNH